jgi:hypothetical protein
VGTGLEKNTSEIRNQKSSIRSCLCHLPLAWAFCPKKKRGRRVVVVWWFWGTTYE